jgi:RNA polymerase sigma-70 factor (ECF subfamily)
VELADHLPAADPVKGAGSDHHLTQEALRQALSQLNDDQRDVVMLRFIVGLPISDVARTLHKSEDAIKGLQRRGLSALKDSLTDLEVSYA